MKRLDACNLGFIIKLWYHFDKGSGVRAYRLGELHGHFRTLAFHFGIEREIK